VETNLSLSASTSQLIRALAASALDGPIESLHARPEGAGGLVAGPGRRRGGTADCGRGRWDFVRKPRMATYAFASIRPPRRCLTGHRRSSRKASKWCWTGSRASAQSGRVGD